MAEKKERGKLFWHKWTVEDAKIFREVLTNEQMGELFFAIMETVDTGNLTTVSKEIEMAYKMYCSKVEGARTAYRNKCDKLAENASLGGKAKAKNREGAEKDTGFKPPTKTDFRNMAKHICRVYELNYDNYEIDNLYERLSGDGWCIEDKRIKEKNEIFAVVYAHFTDMNYDRVYFLNNTIRYFYKTFNVENKHDLDIDVLQGFENKKDEERNFWEIDNKIYREPLAAIEAFFNYWFITLGSDEEDEE